MKPSIMALLAALTPYAASGEGWTAHTVSAHVGCPDCSWATPGLAYDVHSHVRIGALLNSYHKPSAYAVGIIPVRDNVRIGLGAASGYKLGHNFQLTGDTMSVAPVLAIEVDLTDHLSLLWFGQAINLEVKF